MLIRSISGGERMKVFIEKERNELEIKFQGTVAELLKQIEVNSETVLVVKANEILTHDEILQDADEIKLLSVISGG